MAKKFWPGYRWRILAWEKTEQGKKGNYTGGQYDRRSGSGPIAPTDGPGEGNWEFDELVIDHWFHLEQMDDRDWWIGVGDPGNGDYYHINVHIDGDKKVTVSIENESREDE